MNVDMPSWLSDEIRALMGSLPDRELGERFGKTKERIGHWRRTLGIKHFKYQLQRTNATTDLLTCSAEERALLVPPWLTPAVYARLGKVPDHAVALDVGLSKTVILKWRQKLGIRPSRENKNIDWDAVDLGQRSDAEIAREMEVSEPAVQRQRSRRGIPKFQRVVDWTSVDLGIDSDAEIARQLGVDATTVGARRKAAGIPARKGLQRGIDWDAQPLGEISDGEIARRLAMSPSGVRSARRRRGIALNIQPPGKRAPRQDWDWIPLGEFSDADLAKDLDVQIGLVSQARRVRGIPAFVPSLVKGIEWDGQPLGEVTDVQLATANNVNHGTVAAVREARGIERFDLPVITEEDGLGKMVDAEVARRTGYSRARVRTSRVRQGIAPVRKVDWAAVTDDEFRTTSDAVLAARLGASPSSVGNYRRGRGITRLPAPIDWTGVTDLGEVPDREIAERMGISESTVAARRKLLGKEPHRSRVRKDD